MSEAAQCWQLQEAGKDNEVPQGNEEPATDTQGRWYEVNQVVGQYIYDVTQEGWSILYVNWVEAEFQEFHRGRAGHSEWCDATGDMDS